MLTKLEIYRDFNIPKPLITYPNNLIKEIEDNSILIRDIIIIAMLDKSFNKELLSISSKVDYSMP